jgi:hypothetical protein
MQMTSWKRFGGPSIALALLVAGAAQASACSWWWTCDGRPYAYRPTPNGYGYNGQRRPPRAYGYYGYRGQAWAYGYSSPARARGDAYAAWPSTSIPPSRWYLATAPRVPNANAVGLTAPVATAAGLLEGGMPARGPSLFGPNPPPAAVGYYYGAPSGYYYRAPSPYYRSPTPSYYAPPPDTASWWATGRRR